MTISEKARARVGSALTQEIVNSINAHGFTIVPECAMKATLERSARIPSSATVLPAGSRKPGLGFNGETLILMTERLDWVSLKGALPLSTSRNTVLLRSQTDLPGAVSPES